MSATTILAIYAALVATAGLCWQVYQWLYARRTRVEVRARVAIVGAPVTVQAMGIEAINHSDHAVRVSGVGVDLPDDPENTFHLFRPPPGATIPGTIESHDSGQTYVPLSDLKQGGLDVHKPTSAWVRLSTGEIFRSERRPLIRPDDEED